MRSSTGGVEALPGHQIERVEFSKPLPLATGFDWIERYLGAEGVPLTAFCACELRSPGQFTEQGFIDFNRHYTGTLLRWGVMKTADDNPVARSNVIPPIHGPSEPSFYAFCFARPVAGQSGSFVIAGSGEASDGSAPYAERIVATARSAQTPCATRPCSCWGGWKSAWPRWGRAGPMHGDPGVLGPRRARPTG